MSTKDAKQGSETSADTEILDAGDTGTEAVTNEVVEASSSTAQGEAEGKDTPNIVRDVVDERVEKPEAAASPAEGSEAGEGADDAAPKKQDDENFTDVPFHKHPRFQSLLRQRNEAHGDATRYRNVQRFLDDNGLSSEEGANALTIFAQARVDPVGAWAAVKPWVQQLLIAAGEVVPDDLQSRVTAGELTREAAMEIGRERAKATSLESKQKFQTQRTERQAADDLGRSLVGTAQEWETDRRAKDPNFEAKLPLIQKEIAWLHAQEGKPNTPDGVKDQLKRAYKAVNDGFRSAAPAPAARKPAIRPVTGGQVAQNIRPNKPQSTLDIIRAGTARRRAG